MFYPHLWQNIEPALEQYDEIGGGIEGTGRFKSFLEKMGTLLKRGNE